MGILDSKTRTLDTIVTLEGRKQIAIGKLKIEYVSFTDSATYYKADLVSGSADATTRLYLESCNLPQDSITLEADDSGMLNPFDNTSGVQIKHGQILQYTFNSTSSSILTGSNQGLKFLKGSEFASSAEVLLASSVENFKKLRIIGTKDPIFEDDGFAIGNSSISFTINDNRPVSNRDNHVANHEHLDTLFNDVRLSHIQNFKYLPPLNKTFLSTVDKKDPQKTTSNHLGNYKPWGRTKLGGLSGDQLELELLHFEKQGYCKTMMFDPTSRDNRLLGQFFEVNNDTLRKLDVIDFGTYNHKKSKMHAFFIGKVLTNMNGSNTFVHIFTMIFG